MEIKAINTKYKGYNFRSRLEARWAVFLDELGWNWRYEDEGYRLPSGNYLPDFYFPDIDTYAEVKGKKFTPEEINKCRELSNKTFTNTLGNTDTHHVILLDGPPSPRSYLMFKGGEERCDVVFIPKGEKYYPFFYTYDFDGEYFESTLNAIGMSLSKRFEFNGK